MKKKLIITISAITLAFIVIVANYIYTSYIVASSSSNGLITFRIYDIDQKLLLDDSLEYEKGTSLYNLLNKNYEIKTHSIYGGVIMQVDVYQTDWNNTYFAIFINDKYATKGAKELYLNDKDIVDFKIMKSRG